MKSAYTKPFLTAALIILADQMIKIWVKHHIHTGDSIKFLGERGMLLYTENNGMAWSMEFGGDMGKLALTLFRIGAVCAIGYGLVYLIRHQYHRGLIITVALILAGATGNIIDSTFYGVIYGYAPLFHGRVIDMFYFPLISGYLPTWVPFLGGTYCTFFNAVFNLADVAITIGVGLILINQKRYFKYKTLESGSLTAKHLKKSF